MKEFQPSVKAVLDRLAPNYIKGLVYGAMVEILSYVISFLFLQTHTDLGLMVTHGSSLVLR